jgi:phosphoribosylamine--glycine ligase
VESDFFELLAAIADKNMDKVTFSIRNETATTVMLVSGGYPGDYEKGKEITGYDTIKDSLVFHAGTKVLNNKVVTDGGRVIAVTSFGSNKDEALKKSYNNVKKISFEKRNFRTDIGFDL